jgi:hypothetical protein
VSRLLESEKAALAYVAFVAALALLAWLLMPTDRGPQ